MNMILFAVCLVSGFVELEMLLILWGFSSGPLNAVPYVALVGCLILLLIGAPLALYLRRASALFAAVGALAALAWPVAIARSEPATEALQLAVPPAAAVALAAWQVWRTRQVSWSATVSWPHLWVRIALSGVPALLFVSVFNPWLVIALVWAGPS